MVTRITRLHLVRHGESEWNAARRVQGQSSQAPSLTSLGRAQARTAAWVLAELTPRTRLVVSSDLPRARETALIVALALGLPLRCDPGLREQDLGELEGRGLDDAAPGGGTVEDSVEALWQDHRRRPPGGESVGELHRRIHEALARIAAAEASEELVMVTHGGPIRVATVTAPEAVRRRPVGNASVTTVAVATPAPAGWWERRAS